MHRSIQILRRVITPLVIALVALGLFAPPASAANTAVIAGTVRAQQTYDPLPGATVSVYLTSNVTTPVATATTAVDGSYQVGSLAAGTYKVRFSADATTFVQSWYWYADTAADATAISLAEGDQVNWVDGYLSDATTSVAGTVYDTDDASPVQGVIVDLFSTGDLVHPVYTTPTEANGTYLLEGVTPGDYLVRFTPDTDQRLVRWYWYATTAADADPITVAEGSHLTAVDIYLQDATASIAGTVRTWATNLPLPGATVALFTAANTTTALRTTTTAADGSYTFTGLTAGTYKVRFTDGTDYTTQWYNFGTTPDTANDVDLAPGDHLTYIDGQLFDATMSIAGTVRSWATNLPLPGATVALFTAANTTTALRTTTTAADGSYTFTGLTAGTYKVRFTDGTDYTTQWYNYGTTPDTANDVDLAPGDHLTYIDGQLFDATMSIAGTVRDWNNNAGVGNSTVALFHTDNTTTPVATTTTSADGSFKFSVTTEGSYLVRATGPTPFFPDSVWYYQAPNAGAALEIVVAPGDHPASQDVILTSTSPWNADSPSISGTAAVGSVLTATPSTWTPTATAVAYQWYIEDAPVPGATSSTWTVTPAAAGRNVRVAVSASRAGYPTESTTASVVIGAASFTPGVPTISGTARVGSTLTASSGSWTPTPDYYTYDWKLAGSSIGSYDPTLVLPSDAVGKVVTVTVTGHRAGYNDGARTSTATAAVTSGNLTAPAATISGTAAVGRTLAANPGSWVPSTTQLTYQWKAGGTAIPDATTATLQVPASALGQVITASVTGTAAGYTSTTTASAATAAVALGTLDAITPTITGTAAVGATLTAHPGAWRPYPVLMSYQWYVDGVAFPGATKQTFAIPASASGKTITVTATGSVTGYSPASRTSSATAAVTGGTLAGPTPTITGTAQVGQTLTANPGTWGPAPVTLAYQWFANGAALSGATSGTLVVPGTAVNQPITVRVTASKSGFTSVNKTSGPTAAVTAGQITPGTPTISGSAQVGQVLTANTGFWNPEPDTFTYQWKAAGANISGATGATLTIPADALGKTITVVATGVKTGYTTASRESAPTAAVVAATGTLIPAVPTISGTAAVGVLLTASPGTWGPAPVDLAYQWKSNGTNISGATSSILEIPATSLGQTITVTVTGTKTGYTTASQTSLPTAAVANGTLIAPTPTISGSAVVNSVLTANPGSWGPSPVTLTYQWKSNGTNIPGATTASLTVPATTLGQTITVVVTGTKTAYTPASRESAATATVTDAIGTLTTAVPTITGTAQVDGTLTANPGTWGPAPVDLTYQWKSGGTNISGATAATLAVPATSLGQTITVTVTGTKTGYATASTISAATSAVIAGVLTSSTPTISGSAVVGSLLTASAGTWGPTPVTLTYDWKAAGIAISGATGSTFMLTADQAGKTVTVAVTGTKTGYSPSTKESAATAVVTTAANGSISGLVLETDSTPASGIDICLFHQEGDITTRQGQDVGEPAANGRYSFAGVPAGRYVLLFITSGSLLCNSGQLPTAPYWPQWYRWGNAAVDATPITVTVAAPAVSLQTVYMTAGNGGTDAELYAYAIPTITGTPTAGETLTAHGGSWFPAPTTLALQWRADGVTITGATASTYVLTAAEAGKRITVTETASGSGMHTTSATSAQTATVASGTLTGATPTISGTAKVGATLTADPGTWSPAPVTLAYQWKAGGTNITGATTATLLVPADAVGKAITVTVTGTKTGYTTLPKDSAATATVTPGDLTGVTPTITGTAKVGATLTADPGTWSPAPVTLAYQWKAGGTNITGATTATLLVPADAVGKTITMTVTGTKTGYTTLPKDSAATAAVTPGDLTGATPTITGTPAVGATLTANPGTWSPAPVTLAYQWKAGGTNITGATTATLLVPADAVGKTITMTVTGSKIGYTDVTKESGATGAVTNVITGPTPTITGTAKVGSTLTAHPGTWTPESVNLAYAWKAGGVAIAGATGSALVVPASAYNKTITVTVTGTMTGLPTVSKMSVPTGVVAAGTLTGPTPTIAGTVKVGFTLTAKPGTWGPSPVTLKYQWKVNGANISGATATTYKISASYAGKKVTVAVTGTKTGYTTLVRTSASTTAVAAGTLTAPTPKISGTAKVGYTLTAKPGTWGPAPVALKYQWRANGAGIYGAVHSTYKISGAYAGRRITVTVTGSKAGYTTAAKTSASTARVAAGRLVPQTPSISGTAKVGSTLRANPGTWSPAPVTLKYRWKVNGASISGATGKTWKVTSGAKGKRVTVTVTGSKTGYTTVARTSSRTAVVR